jgi:hypothetical protein
MHHERIYWLFGALAAALGVYVFYRASPAFQDALSGASSSDAGNTTGGGAIETLTQLPERIVSLADRGFRNNNPGNIRPAGVAFEGQAGVDADGFGIFSSMQYGIRAIAVILKTYSSRYGLQTVDAIIRRWSATDQDAYVSNVAALLGVDPHDSIDVTDADTLSGLVQGIIRQENGAVLAATITAEQLSSGVQLA